MVLASLSAFDIPQNVIFLYTVTKTQNIKQVKLFEVLKFYKIHTRGILCS